MLLLWGSLLAAAGQTCRVPYHGAIEVDWVNPNEWVATERKRAALEMRTPQGLPAAMLNGAISLTFRAPDLEWVSASMFTVVLSKDGSLLARDETRANFGVGGRMGFFSTKTVPLAKPFPIQVTVVGPGAWSCSFDLDEDGQVRRARFAR